MNFWNIEIVAFSSKKKKIFFLFHIDLLYIYVFSNLFIFFSFSELW